MTYTLDGIHVPVITPLEEDGSVALGALEELAHRLLDEGAAGLVALGTTGEPSTLEPAEADAVVERLATVTGARQVPLTVGFTSNSTRAAVAKARELSADAAVAFLMTTPPYYTRPSEAGAVLHLQEVAAASDKPLIVYNVPYRTARPLAAGALLELARTPGIVGLKQAVGAVDEDTMMLFAGCPDGFAILAGDDAYLYPMLALGARGGILASAHLRTRDVVTVHELQVAGKAAEARALALELLPVAKAAFAEPNPSVIKGVLHAQGRIPTPDLRLPQLPASEAAVRRALELLPRLVPAV